MFLTYLFFINLLLNILHGIIALNGNVPAKTQKDILCRQYVFPLVSSTQKTCGMHC